MKVDVEGHELGVLEGARSILSNNPGITLVVEWSVAQMRDAQVDPARLTSFLMELGFEYRLAESGNAIDGNSLLSIPYGNLIAQRPTNR
jgi:hypothetical protein